MKSELIRAKLIVETEVVIENFYGEDEQKCAESAIRSNIGEIIIQAYESNQVKVTDVLPVTKKEHLPPKWDGKCLPWLPSISYGDRKQEKFISEFLKA